MAGQKMADDKKAWLTARVNLLNKLKAAKDEL